MDRAFNEQKIYLSIEPDRKINESSFKIYIKIEDSGPSKVICETSIKVEQNKDGFFSIKK